MSLYRKPYFWFLYFLLLVLLIIAGYRDKKNRAARRSIQSPDLLGQRIQIGQHSLYLLIAGDRHPGQPLVVLESGHGDWSRAWNNVFPAVSKFARVMTYDRAGFGWSDSGPSPRTPVRIVTELHELLSRAAERPPYILVGHSMGGPFSRLYYSLYPEEVAGMVWVDSAHEDLPGYIPFLKKGVRGFLWMVRLGWLLAHVGLGPAIGKGVMAGSFPSVREPEQKAVLATQVADPRFYENIYDETLEMVRPENWLLAPRTLGNLPVIHIEAQYTPEPPPGYPRKLWDEFLTGWRAIHRDISGLSTDLRRIPANTGHVVMAEQPELVIQAIREMVERLSIAQSPPNDLL